MEYCKVRDVKSPERGTSGSAGIDFFVPNDFDTVVLNTNESILIPAGIKVNLKPNQAMIMTNKSSIAAKRSLVVGACLIDEDYQGEIHINLINIGKEPQKIEAGMKIVQGVIHNIVSDIPQEFADEKQLYLNKESERGSGGFGSTGSN